RGRSVPFPCTLSPHRSRSSCVRDLPGLKCQGCPRPFTLLLILCFVLGSGSSTPAAQSEPITGLPARAQASASALDPALAQAKAFAESGRAAEAEPLARQAIAKNPASADAHFLLGYILFREI